VALIAAGYFFDVIDFTVFGSLVPLHPQSKFATGAEVAAIGSATIFGLFVGTAGQGEFSDRFGRRFIYQFNLLLFGVFTILGAFAPSVTLLIACRFIAGIGLGAEQPLGFCLCRRICAQAHSRPHLWRSCISSAAPAYGRSERRWCSWPAASSARPNGHGAASGC
jgi:MFS family permease